MNRLAVQFLDKTGHYRWRPFSQQGRWLAQCGEGSLEELIEQATGLSLCLLLDGDDVVIRQLRFNPKEKKHLARLVPFELESGIAADINGLHVALAVPAESTVEAAYVERALLRRHIEPLEKVGLWVESCRIIPQLLSSDDRRWLLNVRDDGRLDLACANQAMTIHTQMLQETLRSLMAEPQYLAPEQISVCVPRGHDADGLLVTLDELLPGCLCHVEQLAERWDALQPDRVNAIDLRQGAFAPPVRWQRFWTPFRVPLAATAVAIMLFVITTVVEIQLNASRFERLQQQIETAYRLVVPQGMLVDAEQQLMTQIQQLRGNSSDNALMPILHAAAPVLLQYSQVNAHRLNFNAAQGELQLAVTAASNADILTLTDTLNEAGLNAQARNISTVGGDRQQASLLISRRAL